MKRLEFGGTPPIFQNLKNGIITNQRGGLKRLKGCTKASVLFSTVKTV
jgi:hypothetical protein